MTIEIQIKNVYGVEKIYPACKKAELFASIAGTTTLTHSTLCLVEQLGYEIKIVTAPKGWREI